MSRILASLGGNTGAVVAGGAMIVALGFGAYIGFAPQDDRTVPVAVETADATTPAVTASNAQTPVSNDPVSQLPAETIVAAQPPKFDELRRENDGTTIIAGRAEPLSEVAIIVDGTEVATTTADSSGGFAAITVLPPKDTAQIVSLSSQSLNIAEQATESLDEIILAPTRVPVVLPEPAVPQAEPQIATAPATQDPEPKVAAQAQPDNSAEETADAQSEVTLSPEPSQDPARVAVLKSDAEGVSLLNPSQPEVMTSVALDTIGYSEAGDVQLTGRAQPDTARVRVYLDNRSIITLPVDAQGRWRGDLPDVDEGVYTLRVDEVSTEGDVSSRVETPFKRESAETLAQAASNDGPIKSITVQTGATLWAIARDRYGDGTLYVRVVEANAASIRNPDLIYPGQVFDLPN